MIKSTTAFFLLFSVSLVANAAVFSKSNNEIIALANSYKNQLESISESQTDSTCYDSLTNAIYFVSYIPKMITLDRNEAKNMAIFSEQHIHTSTLNNCLRLNELKTLDQNMKNLISEF